MATVTTVQRHHRDELLRRVASAGDVSRVFDVASTRLRRLVPFDAAVWVSTDPATGLPAGPTMAHDLDDVTPAQCSSLWHHEFVDDDVNRFGDLTRASRPAATLRAATGDPRRSRRYRTFMRPLGFDDELRAVLRAGEAPWGSVTLWRRRGRPAFDTAETELVAGLAAPLGEALRLRARPADHAGVGRYDPPGLMIFATDGRLVSADEHARAWLAELPPERAVPNDLGLDVPVWLVVTVLRAAAVVSGGTGDGTARARVRPRRGRWLVCHASCTARADGAAGDVAVVLEPATPAEIAPLIVEAYDLTVREREITGLIARGNGTADIAGELYLSAHTVRDHVKTIFHKVGVSSRGELVAKLYADHFEPAHLAHRERATAG